MLQLKKDYWSIKSKVLQDVLTSAWEKGVKKRKSVPDFSLY